MLINKSEFNNIVDSYWQVIGYQRQLKGFYQFLDQQFKAREYGIALEPICYNKLFTHSKDYTIYDPQVYPFDVWIPQWYGRYYINPLTIPPETTPEDTSLEKTEYLAFVWHWIGLNDAYVPDTTEPECWFGIAKPETEHRTETLKNVAQNIWNHFRVELTDETTEDGWLKGHYDYEKVECRLKGWWLLKRLPLSQLVTSYQIQQSIVRPIAQKYAQLI
jgi:hypothetical protein